MSTATWSNFMWSSMRISCLNTHFLKGLCGTCQVPPCCCALAGLTLVSLQADVRFPGRVALSLQCRQSCLTVSYLCLFRNPQGKRKTAFPLLGSRSFLGKVPGCWPWVSDWTHRIVSSEYLTNSIAVWWFVYKLTPFPVLFVFPSSYWIYIYICRQIYTCTHTCT